LSHTMNIFTNLNQLVERVLVAELKKNYCFEPQYRHIIFNQAY